MKNINNAPGENGKISAGAYVPFRFEYLLDADENAPCETYRPFRNPLRPWPILCKVTLDNVVLGTHIGINDEINQYQAAGFSFDPGSIRWIIINIERDKECVYKLGDGWHVPLKFSPAGEWVMISIYEKWFNKKIITFDYTKVQAVIVKKELVTRELSTFLACLKKDTDKYLPGTKVF
ncbi:MAG: hypothetical protein Q7R35_10680 [Elusimicrobiota bacterium]|nr:hypothetical protein [Elusimicrobiota bacterium]